VAETPKLEQLRAVPAFFARISTLRRCNDL
jgi:hypothetical protein